MQQMNKVATALAKASETKALRIGAGVLNQAGELFLEQFPGQRAVVVTDPRTYDIAGRDVERSLREAGVGLEPCYIFTDPALYAEFRFVEMLDMNLRSHGAIPVAVGSGTINDLTKLSSFRNGRRYMCVATAASMDGYTAFGASITFEGAKQTFNCPAPQAVLADTTIIATAPPQMSASGYADLFAKIPAGADWILSEELGVEPIDPVSFFIVQDGLKEALADPEGVRSGKVETIEPLIEGLILGGFAMQAHKTSRPASGADHQFSHLWNMEHHRMSNGLAPSHGFQVSIGALASTALYEQFFAEDIASLDVEACVAAWPRLEEAEARALKMFEGTDFPTIGAKEIGAKYVTHEELRRQLTALKENWPRIRARLEAQIVPFAEAQRRLEAAGAPTRPEQIDISPERMKASFLRAQHIRRRFTILDIAVRTCNLDKWVGAIFGPGGVWETPAEKN